MRGLRLMQDLGIKKVGLRLSGESCNAERAAWLSQLLEQQAGLLSRPIAGFELDRWDWVGDFGSWQPWLALMQQHLAQGGVIEFLDFADLEFGGGELSAPEWDDIAELVAQCTSLRELHLKGLKILPGHMDRLAQAIAVGSVQKVWLWFCGLGLADAQSLIGCALQRSPGSGLRVIDFSFNDKMHQGANARQAVIALVKLALQNPDLQELGLPSTVWALFNNRQAAAELMQVIRQSGHTQLIKLGRLPWLSYSESDYFDPLRQFLEANIRRSKT